jgi:hypothetical protein
VPPHRLFAQVQRVHTITAPPRVGICLLMICTPLEPFPAVRRPGRAGASPAAQNQPAHDTRLSSSNTAPSQRLA